MLLQSPHAAAAAAMQNPQAAAFIPHFNQQPFIYPGAASGSGTQGATTGTAPTSAPGFQPTNTQNSGGILTTATQAAEVNTVVSTTQTTTAVAATSSSQ
jgi:hypothetical protein